MENNFSQQPDNTSKKRFPIPYVVKSNQYLWLIGLFTLAGVVGGYAYYAFIGCTTGGCAITSNPYLSMLWGGAMGYLVPDFFIKKNSKTSE